MAETKKDELRNKIYGALGDSQAPWYGSDLVSWVGDYIEEIEKQVKELEETLDAECRVSQMLLTETKRLKSIFFRSMFGKF